MERLCEFCRHPTDDFGCPNCNPLATGQPIGMRFIEVCESLGSAAKGRVLASYDPAAYADFTTTEHRGNSRATDQEFWRVYYQYRAKHNAFFQNLVMREYWSLEG